MSERKKIRVGIESLDRTIEVNVPRDDAAPWDLDTKFRHVRGDTSRIDGVAKVTGQAKYAYDINRPGQLHGVLLRSPHARARLRSVDVSAALAMPGVRAALPTKQPGNRLRFVGDDVAAIAAETLDQARDALEKVVVEYTVEAHNTDYLQHPDAPERATDGEIIAKWPGGKSGQRGASGEEIEAELARATHRAEGTWTTEVQTHSSLETHGMVVEVKSDGTAEVWASTQATFGVRAGIAAILRIKQDQVRVHADFIGGGFGSKFSPGAEGAAAAKLSQAAKAPVKVMLDRFEEHTCAGNRPGATIQIRAGTNDEGVITAWDYRSFGGPGHTGRGGQTRMPPHYNTKAKWRSSHRDLATDTDAARAMRAPGYPQGFFAAEGMVDMLARKNGMDPLAFRLLNDGDALRRLEWERGATEFGWQDAHNRTPGQGEGRFLRGAGMGSAMWGQMGRPGNAVTCRIHQDGTVEVRNGAQDIGTGMKTVMAVLAAEELGIDPDRIKVTMGDSLDPIGPGSGGSTTTPSLAPTVRHAVAQAAEQLCERVSVARRVEPHQVSLKDGKVVIASGEVLPFDWACKLLGPNSVEATGRRFRNYGSYLRKVCGAQFAQVEVDRHTGAVRVIKMLGVQDCGTVIAKKLAESQVLGAMIQGVSYALHEQRILDHRSGRMLNGDLALYKIAGSVDVPELRAILLDVRNGGNNVGAAGLGEPPAIAAAAAIANAVTNAIGSPMCSLPITPDKVLAGLAKGGN